MLYKTLVTIFSLSLAVLTGCASTPTPAVDGDVAVVPSTESAVTAPTFGNYRAQGFLTDYSKINQHKDDSDGYGYIDPAVDFGKYDKLLVDRIKIFFKADSEYKGIDPDELKVLTDYYYDAINKAVGDAYPMVTEAGPDVLRLRVAITDLVPNEISKSVVTLVVPFLWIGDAGTGVVTGDAGSTMFTGHASVELEVLDSVSSEQLMAYIDTQTGKKYNWTRGIATGAESYMRAYSKWAYTKQAMDGWAQLLRLRLDEVHGISANE